MEDDPVFGRLVASNLTAGKGGVGGSYSDTDFVRAIRHGVRPDGTPLVLMPAEYYNKYNDEDLGAIIAYIKSLPPVDNELPETMAGPLARLFVLLEPSLLPAQLIDHDASRPPPSNQVLPRNMVSIWRSFARYATVRICQADQCPRKVPKRQRLQTSPRRVT